jgi:hypothetical protein
MSRNPSGAQATEAIGVEPTLPSLQLLLREPVTTASFLDSDATVPDRSKDGSLAANHPSLGVRRRQIIHRTCYRYPLRHSFRPLSLIYSDYYWQTSPELQDQFVIRYG